MTQLETGFAYRHILQVNFINSEKTAGEDHINLIFLYRF